MNEQGFNDMISPEPNSGCWLWAGALNSKGYGNVRINGRNHLAHRVSYTMHKGPIPSGLELDHLCRVTSCVNPDHLEAVTHQENCRRGDAGKICGAWQRAKTHCPQGHAYAGDNLFFQHGGRRACRACSRRANSLAYHKSRRA